MTKRAHRPVIIRGQEAEDWEDVAAIFEGERVVAGTLQLPYQSRDAIRDRIENPRPDIRVLVAVVEGRVVGTLGLHFSRGRQAHMAHLGMMVHDSYQGQGIGAALLEAAVTLAERWLAITRLELTVYTDNEPALALYRKFGFEIEGTLRDYAFRDGRYVDAYLMARLRDKA
ncbi:MAG: GNAT family N-acetyltransferase [Chloroflexota bacterium]|nr:GNAT family N-acetyltransferase [Anaerolineae bacterium]HMM28795.1 GNAT family N-acetyltransferase [Aggregatilineaceae bacterium]